jgi:hypothetical protein
LPQLSQRQGGQRRIDHILDPAYTDNLQSLELAEVKRRRDECLAEREYQSLLRRLVQGRLDIVRAEKGRRDSGDDEGSLVDNLVAALSSDASSTSSRGEALRLTVPPDEMTLARRRVESLVADTNISDPRSLADDELEEAATRLESEERNVSADRAAVIEVHDRLQDELKRRYKKDPSEALAP